MNSQEKCSGGAPTLGWPGGGVTMTTEEAKHPRPGFAERVLDSTTEDQSAADAGVGRTDAEPGATPLQRRPPAVA